MKKLSSASVPRSSLPLPLADRTWSSFILGTVCTSTGVATWSFVIGGSAALYLGAGAGIIAMIAGALIGQLLVTLATVPPSTKFGIETTISTKPQLGVRGVYIGLFMMLFNAVGWNTVLMIFFGRAAASVLVIFGAIDDSSRGIASIICSSIGLVIIGLAVSRGSRSLSKTGPIIAACIVVLAIWLVYLLIEQYGISGITDAEPLSPHKDGLLNYTLVVEMLIGGTFGWWGYMGGIVRMVSSAKKTVLPTMLGLGLAWAVVASVSLFGALLTGEADPTIWVPKITGKVGAVLVLVFISMANLGSTLVGVYVSTLAVKQTQNLGRRLSWGKTVGIVVAPMLFLLIFLPNFIFDNVPIFMAFLGMVTGPMIGVQIADWFVLRRGSRMFISSLYLSAEQSKYRYLRGFNPAGILALLLGSGTYLAIMNPYTLIPNSPVFPYITASLPAVVVGGVAYVLGSRLMWRLFPKTHPLAESERAD